VILRLSEWAQGLHVPHLWLDSTAIEADDTRNASTSLTAKSIGLVGMNSLACLSTGCEIPRAVSINVTREIKGTASLLYYAILRQMVELLLPRLETTVDLLERRFLSLDGSLDTWSEALKLFRDLTSLVPGNVCFVWCH
jgi:hypothetical protein